MKTKWFIFTVCLCSFMGLALAQQRTSETDPRFKRFLAQYPKADKNKDGILTAAEWRAYQAETIGPNSTQPNRTGARIQKTLIHTPDKAEFAKFIEMGKNSAQRGPLSFEKGNGLRIVMTGHSWVAPGRNKLLEIAEAAGYTGHHQRIHGGGGSTGAANAIWLKEFGKWNEDTPPAPILLPAIATGEWDVMTWGCYYDDLPEYYTQWIDFCLENNPEMRFYIQDGWPRHLPSYKEKQPDEVMASLEADHKYLQKTIAEQLYTSLEEKYPGKVHMIPAGEAVMKMIRLYHDGKLPEFDCIDEDRGRAGKRGIYRDGGHLSRTSGIEQLVGYMYFGMLYRRSPETIADYAPEGISERVDRIMRRVAWEAIVESPYAGIDDENRDGLAD